ncbi:MAG TPA: ATP-binding protein [Rudaea sp.]|jgi:signal transduction histidine kinase/ActR/RegA family two-component response regulator
MKHWGIRTRVLFLAMAPSLMILLALVTYFTYQRIEEVDVSLAERGKLIARRLAPGTEYAIFAGDRAALQRLADAASSEVDVSSITINDALGHELAHSRGRVSATADLSLRFTEAVKQTRLAVGDFPEQIQASDGDAKIGEISVVMSRVAAAAQQRRLLLTGLALGLLGIALAVLLAVLIGNGVIRPIRRLANAMVDLGRGGRVRPIPTDGGGELSTLAEGFNQMAARLQADARELEARIEEATRALVVQKDAAEKATRAKSRFIAAASHDLRQPLHAIGLFSSALQRRVQGADLQTVAADLAQAVGIMERLFNSLLDISRLDAGALGVSPRAFALDRLFAQLAAEHADAAARKQLRLRFRPTGMVVLSDELLVHRILTNLVANAIRYTRSGSALVCCRPRGDALQIEVRDSGIGIAPEKHEDIFLEFYRNGDAGGDEDMGLGLGLAIVSRLARLLGTRVLVRSALGRGSTFSLRLPRGDAATIRAPVEVAQARAEKSDLALHVLVVDDDPLVLAGNRALLEEIGCTVTSAADTARALAALAALANEPALVLCDMWLGDGQNGIDLLRRASALAGTKISGILISGDTGVETQRAADEAGYLLLHKPVAPAKLRAVVMNFAWKVREMNTAGEIRDENPAG